MRFYADHVEYFVDTNRMIATGNVLLIESDHQIAADRADFNAKTRLGTFYNARGFATLGPPPGRASQGRPAATRRPARSDPDVQFFGETLEKTGEDTYIITKGGFTSCVQANPRWEMTSGSLKLRVDHYALLRNMFLKVKGVPAIYLPMMYYPLSKDNRSTGFLMPSYGSSSYKGQTISNAFFWAINRSQDATFLHDWYSKTGQAVAGEYRYVSLGGSGNIRTDFLNEHPTTFVGTDGEPVEQEGRRTFRTYGNLSQSLGGSWYAQARADYSSDLLSIASMTRTSRGRHGARGATADRRAARPKGSALPAPTIGTSISPRTRRHRCAAHAPRINVVPAGSSPAGTAGVRVGELGVRPHRAEDSSTQTHALSRDEGLHRFDIVPAVRFPFNKLAFHDIQHDSAVPQHVLVAEPARRNREWGGGAAGLICASTRPSRAGSWS